MLSSVPEIMADRSARLEVVAAEESFSEDQCEIRSEQRRFQGKGRNPHEMTRLMKTIILKYLTVPGHR